jgi:DNA topoisomerase I
VELSKEPLTLARNKISSLGSDAVKYAEAINLVYINDRQPGINRVRKGDGFIYTFHSRPITTKKEILRINSLVIPPAWEQVWICPSANGHIQATGIDAKGRKQYRYHPLWTALRKETKFFHMHDFGKALPLMRKRMKEDISLNGFSMQKVLAVVVSVMENTGIRIGNDCYEKMYGSYGLTTLKNKHVDIKGNEIKFGFTGKKGVHQNLTLKSKRLARIIQQCKDIPGKDLFQYYDENGIRNNVDSGMVNNYIRDISGSNFTAKDFRTWFGTICALAVLLRSECCNDINGANKIIIEALDVVAKRLGNTRMVCRKYYVHPMVIDHYSNHNLEKYATKPFEMDGCEELSHEETILMAMLSDMKNITIGK